jgi:DNA polymerase-3 subunit epsilon/CBS domain-containing protein
MAAAPSNAVAVKHLSARDREGLRAAFEAVKNLDRVTRNLLFEAAYS